jgi:hypothetical protein
MWDALRSELRELVWLVAVVAGLSATGVGLALLWSA